LSNVSLIICLDSGAGSYDTFFMTTSLRGLLMTKLKVSTLTEGVHSGGGGGICADSFRIIRQLLSAIENEATGEMIEDFQVVIPETRMTQNRNACKSLGDAVWKGYPLVNGIPMEPKSEIETLALNRGWRAGLTITGIDGIAGCATGGNVLRPSTTVKLSIRLPPTYDHTQAFARLEQRFKAVLPPNAKMELSPPVTAKGWDAPATEPWLENACDRESKAMFDQPPCDIFEGGSIPFLGMLQDMFPLAQFCVTGVLGPHSNAHGPNEFLDIDYCKRVVVCVAGVLASHGVRPRTTSSGGVHSGNEKSAAARIAGAAEDKLVQQKMAKSA
jgi:acetylornithine deacetylase/succinyl-diaminopimelate desuccinylase-like protein